MYTYMEWQQEGSYLRLYEVLAQLSWNKVLQALNETVSPQTAQDQQLLEWVQFGVPLSWKGLPISKHTHTHPARLMETAQYKCWKHGSVCTCEAGCCQRFSWSPGCVRRSSLPGFWSWQERWGPGCLARHALTASWLLGWITPGCASLRIIGSAIHPATER